MWLLPTLVVFIGGIIAAWSSFRTGKGEAGRLGILIGTVIGLTGVVLGDFQRQRFERLLSAKSNQLVEAYTKVVPSITGGDGFCYLNTKSVVGKSENLRKLMIHNTGDYPVYDIHVEIFDKDKYTELAKRMSGVDARLESGINMTLGNAPPHSSMIVPEDWVMPEGLGVKSYTITISARNGIVTQELTLRKVNGEWREATRVTREKEGQKIVLLEDAHPQFPRDQLGKPLW